MGRILRLRRNRVQWSDLLRQAQGELARMQEEYDLSDLEMMTVMTEYQSLLISLQEDADWRRKTPRKLL